MKGHLRTSLLSACLLLPAAALAQIRLAKEFQITEIVKNLISSPQFTYAGAEQFPAPPPQRWLEVDVEFVAASAVTDELTVKYFILFSGTLLTGEVTHTNVLAGRERRSVMYVSPRTISRFSGNRPITPKSVQNIAVQILQKGVVKDELSLARASAQWYAALPQVSGLVLNKNETPFAPLYWERYEQIKTSGR
jgi:hypothetical protein